MIFHETIKTLYFYQCGVIDDIFRALKFARYLQYKETKLGFSQICPTNKKSKEFCALV